MKNPGDNDRGARRIAVVATYNERENIALLCRAILAEVADIHVLVIDDSSPDGTGAIVEELSRDTGRVHLLSRPGKQGLGSALLEGLRWARGHGYGLAVVMDADFSHEPRYLPALLDASKDYDLVIGSRYVPGGGVLDWGFLRQLSSVLTNIVSRLLLGLTARDVTGGFRCYNLRRLDDVDLSDFRSRGFSFQEEMATRCMDAGWSIGEVPIIFKDRTRGQSKVSLSEIVGSLATLLVIGIKRLGRRWK